MRITINYVCPVELRYRVSLDSSAGDDNDTIYTSSLGYAKQRAWRLAQERRESITIEVSAFDIATGERLETVPRHKPVMRENPVA